MATWNALMAKEVDGRFPNVKNQIVCGDQVLALFEKGRLVEIPMNHQNFVKYVSTHTGGKITLQLAHLPPGLLQKKLTWRGEGHPSRLRSVAWRVFLGEGGEGNSSTLSLDSLLSSLKNERAAYSALRQQFPIPTDETVAELKEEFDKDPLAAVPNESQEYYQKNKEILSTLRKDITRTFSELDFFQKQETQEMLERILFIWDKSQSDEGDDKETNYMQGMHELLAVVVMVFLKDIHRAHPATQGNVSEIKEEERPKALDDDGKGSESQHSQSDPPAVQPGWSQVVSLEHLESDSYSLFTSLMNVVLPFYSGASHIKGQADGTQPFLYSRVQHIHYVLLQRYDPDLFAHLEAAQVLPHLYLIRWLRLLFTREFNIEQSFLVWDLLLQTKGLELVDYVCVAMLSFIRDDLLSLDTATCLTRVFHYPALDNGQVSEVLSLAQALYDGTIFNFSKRPIAVPKVLTNVSNSLSSFSFSSMFKKRASRAGSVDSDPGLP